MTDPVDAIEFESDQPARPRTYMRLTVERLRKQGIPDKDIIEWHGAEAERILAELDQT